MNPSLLAHRRAPRAPLLKTLSDEELAELIAQGHEEAFETLVTRHRRVLLNHCSQLVGRSDAEEAVQETLLRAYLSLSRGHSVQRVSAWLRTIAHNTALNLLRARGARPAPAEQEPSEVARDPFEQREHLRLVLEALGSLPERQREALVMRELEGRSYAEIESRLRTSNGAVRQLLNRGRARLRTRLGTLTGIEPALRWLMGNGSAGSSAVRLGALGGGCAVTAKLCATALLPAALAPAPPVRAQAAQPLQHLPGHVSAARNLEAAIGAAGPRTMPVSYRSPTLRAAASYVVYHPVGAGAPRTGSASRSATDRRAQAGWTGGTPSGGSGRGSSDGQPYNGGGGTSHGHQGSSGGGTGSSAPGTTQSSSGAPGHGSGANGSPRAATPQSSFAAPQRAPAARPARGSAQGGSGAQGGNGIPGGSAIGNSRPAGGTLASATPSGTLSSSP